MKASPGTAYVRWGRKGVEEVGEVPAEEDTELGGYVSRIGGVGIDGWMAEVRTWAGTWGWGRAAR